MSQNLFFQDKIKYEEKFQKIKNSLITRYLAEKLKREQELVKYNNSILNSKYLDLKRKEKKKEILENINNFKAVAENVLILKDNIQNIFEKSFQDEADLNLFVFTNLILVKDKLVENFQENIVFLKNEFTKMVEEIKVDFENDKIEIEKNYSNHLKQIDDQILAIEANFYYDMKNDEKSFDKEKELIKCENLTQVMTLKFNMEKKMNDLRGVFEKTKRFVDREMALIAKPGEILNKNKKIETDVLKDRLKIKGLQDRIINLEEEINFIDINFLLKNKKKAIHEKYHQYKMLIGHISFQKNKSRKKIFRLVERSSSAIKHLETNLKKCKKILKLFEICQKLETLDEKKTFFCEPVKANETDIDEIISGIFGQINKINGERIKNLFHNDQHHKEYNFYLKYSKVNLELKSLKMVKLNLENENSNLKQILKNYISGLEINCQF